MLSIEQAIKDLEPIDLDVGENAPPADPSRESPSWEGVAKSLGRVGKQQLRAQQQAELVFEELKQALHQSNQANSDLREKANEYRRKSEQLEADGRHARLAALHIIDALDDLAVIARQKDDPQWLGRVDRLSARTLDALSEMRLTEVSARGEEFDETRHEIVHTVERGSREAHLIVEVVRRGFRFEGGMLRRAQVVTTS